MYKKNKGFTLIELLVVIAILGLLATIVAVSLTSARARARDARRVSDIRQLELAFELYYAAFQQYPTTTPFDVLRTNGYLNMSANPKDPSSGDEYCYASGDAGGVHPTQYYHVGALLENADSDMLSQDRDFDSTASAATFTLQSINDTCGDGTLPGFSGTDPMYDRAVSPQGE